MAPDELRDIFAQLIDENAWSEEEQAIVKQAAALCAYLKCLEEPPAGTNESGLATARLQKTLDSLSSSPLAHFKAS